ncbi:hypothetical protein V8C86DRAFT_3149980 [Haematococcus lacustris]
MKPQGAATKRSTIPCIALFLACLLCLGTGFYLGKLYHPGTQETVITQVVDAALGSINRVVVDIPTPAKPVYSSGVTQYKGITSKEGASAVCLNTCIKARNGECNDGRPKLGATDIGVPYEVLCDLGTDCDDCGAWVPSGHVPWTDSSTPGPVSRLVAKGVKVLLKKTVTAPPFHFAYTDPTKDVDVSGHMEHQGVVERGITKLFYQIFKQGCMPSGPGGKRGLFVDVGSNFGWFAVQAASLGCRVLAFEPVPHFHAFLEYSVHLNGLAHLVDMRSNVVSHETGKTMEMFVPSRGIWGTAGIGGLNIDRAVANSTNEALHVPSQTLDELVAEQVLLMKVDVEGWEWSVMAGAAYLLNRYSVHNIVMEYSPGVPERHFKMKEMAATVQMLVNLVDAGYRIAHLGDATKHVGGSWDSPLPVSEEVTRNNLMYDLVDVALFAESKLGCPLPPALERKWGICNALPEDVNPRSLRSVIGHNTNLWASKRKDLPLSGTVGVIKLDAPANQYFVPTGSIFGSGSRQCAHLPTMVQVRHRCPCTEPAVCGEEQAAAQVAAQANQITSSYTLTPDGKLVAGGGAAAEVLVRIGTADAVGAPYRPGVIKGPLSDVNKPLTL